MNAMHHIFARRENFTEEDGILRIAGEDVHHIVRVLRMKAGEELSVSFPDDNMEYRFGIETVTPDEVFCRLRFVKQDTAELPVRIVLLQGLPKSDKMEQIIEKNTELGVSSFVPVALARSVMKLDEKKAPARVARWQKIAEAAAKQARRGVIPEVEQVMTLAQALQAVKDCDHKILPYELLAGNSVSGAAQPEEAATAAGSMAHTHRVLERIRPGESVAVFIGPEGGFTEEEVQAAQAAGFETITLGGRILRTETAGMAVSAWLSYLFST